MENITNFLSQSQQMSWFAAAPWLVAVLLIWSLVWKGMALWKSARLSHKWWFIILLLVNTMGILEIIYIYGIARKYSVEAEKPAQSTM